ncbi:MAG: PorT family protein [Prevotella sp.]|jgi:hypothetical protein|nr:PorT family protein [Prevotella sp.]
MKRFTLIAFILFTTISLFAQYSPSLNLSIRAGANVSNSTWDIESDFVNKKGKIGFQGGVMLEYSLPNNPFDLQTGLFLTTKGAKLKTEDNIIGGTGGAFYRNRTLNQMYLEMPVFAVYKMYMSNSTCVYFNLGPYIAYGIGGKNKEKITGNTQIKETPEEDTFGKSDKLTYGNLKKFDFGIGGGVGMEVGRIIVGLSCELGLTNLSNNNSYKYKNVSSLATLGYKF